MSHSVAARFELVLLHDFSATDARQVPFVGAVVQFYGQGATVSNNSFVSSSSTIDVFDTGDLYAGATITVGLGGPSLTVTAINSPTQIAVSGSGGFMALAGTRLMLTTDRPDLFSDPVGTTSLGHSLTADERGRIAAYIRSPRFDYVVEGETAVVTHDAVSSASISGGYTTSWTHTTSANPDRVMFVAISWTGTSGGEAIESVTYNGVPLLFVSNASFTDVYVLPNPPSGSHTVMVAFNNVDVVNAVIGAVTVYGALTQGFFDLQANGATSGTSATAALSSTASSSVLLAFLGIGNQTSFASVTPGQTSMWSGTAGGSPYRTNGNGERTAGTGGNVTMSFSWSGSRQWGILAVELKAATSRLFADASANAYPVPDWLSARSFPSLQDAIDALPDSGGVVYLPAGNYEVTNGIVVPMGKAVHLLGDGIDRTVIYTDDPDVNVVWIKGSYSTIEKLTIRGADTGPTGNDALKGRGVVVGTLNADAPADQMRRVSLIDCRITKTGSYCYHVLGRDDEGAENNPKCLVLWGHVERTTFEYNHIVGAVRIGFEDNGHVFLNSAIDHFRGAAFNAHGASGLSLINCTLEDRQPNSGTDPYVVLTNASNVLLSSCWFEAHASDDTSAYFVQIGGDESNSGCHDVLLQNTRFSRNVGGFPRAVSVVQQSTGIAVVGPTCHLQQSLGSRAPGDEDIYVALAEDPAEQSQVLISGGIVTSAIAPATSGLVVTPTTGVTLLASGLRLTPPLVSTDQRDDTYSLAADRKQGDLIYNQDSGGLQFWNGEQWVPNGRIAALDTTSNGTGNLIDAGVGGLYRVSMYVSASATNSGIITVAITWNDGADREHDIQLKSSTSPVLFVSDEVVLKIADATAIGYDILRMGGGGGTFAVSIRVEAY